MEIPANAAWCRFCIFYACRENTAGTPDLIRNASKNRETPLPVGAMHSVFAKKYLLLLMMLLQNIYLCNQSGPLGNT